MFINKQMTFIVILDECFNIVNANPEFYKKVLPKRAATGLNFSELFQLCDKQTVVNFCQISKISGMETFECKVMTFPNEVNSFPVLLSSKWTLSKNIQGYTAVTVETDKIIKNETEEELKDFFNKAPIALHWLSSTGKILWANDTELKTLGYTREEYIGHDIMKFCPDSSSDILEIFQQLGSGNTIRNVPVRFRKKNGEIQDLLIDSNVNYTSAGDFNHTRCFIRDDTGRMIRDARARMESENESKIYESKKKYLTMIMHVLKTPIHVIYMLSSSGYDTEIFHQATMLEGIVTSISKAIKFDNGYTIVPVPTGKILSRLVYKIIHSHTLKNKVEFIYNFEDDLTVKIDGKIFKTILGELITHADTRTNEDIRLIVSQTDNNFQFVIEDRGVKLDETRVEEVFHNYWMVATEELSSVTQATDVKLNVAFNYAECLGSKLYVISDDEKTQLVFDLSLSIIDDEVISSRDSSDSSEDIQWKGLSPSIPSVQSHIVEDTVENERRRSSVIPPILGLDNLSKKHILLVEDNSICQKICKRMLVDKLGHSCETADNGKIAVEMVQRNELNIYDLVLMDIRMPIMDGLEASGIISKIYPKLPIVAFSAEEISEEELKRHGIFSILRKPATISHLENAINKYTS